MTKKKLKYLIQKILWDAPNYYRCYEITRKLRTELASEGILLKVKDGIVFYNMFTFFDEAKRGNCNLFLRKGSDLKKLIKTARLCSKTGKDLSSSPEGLLFWRLGVQHSWAIMPKDGLLIDCHKTIDLLNDHRPLFKKFPILNDLTVLNFLRIIPIRKSPTKMTYLFGDAVYWETAIQKGDTIFYPPKIDPPIKPIKLHYVG